MLRFSNDPDLAEQQMCAIIFYLTAFGYIDGEFDLSEKTFVRLYIRKLVEARANDAMPDASAEMREEVVSRFTGHFHEIFEHINREVRELFGEAVANGENVENFVLAKLKLRSYEIFRSFDEANQRELLGTVDELINADGRIDPAEAEFREEIEALLDAQIPEVSERKPRRSGIVTIAQPAKIAPKADNHPFFAYEQHYSADPVRLRKQANEDHDLIVKTMYKLEEQRSGGGRGKLAGHHDINAFTGDGPFLDDFVYVHPVGPDERYELTVLGDLHGCYSCLKGAILQSDFLGKVERYKADPSSHPHPKLVLLGDYIDRGHFSYNGVLRTVMQLYLAMPEFVYMLRGNHEYYIEYRGRIYGGVKPAEAINTLEQHMPKTMFEAYMNLFESLPNSLIFGHHFFVHAGIPRDSTLEGRWRDLSSLNDPEIRFQMLWSDPSAADFIPRDLQEQNARFPFGQRQFEDFMDRIGCTTMVRGHEKINDGFREVYPDGDLHLFNLFSAGGADNGDLPEDSSYRAVTPMAMTVEIDGEESQVIPWEIDYQSYNQPERNLFFATEPEIEHKTG